MHLPSAFWPFLFVPYLAANAAGSASRSALQSLTAWEWFSSTTETDLDTHLPSAFERFLFVPYACLNATVPMSARSALQNCAAFLWSLGETTAVALTGTASATTVSRVIHARLISYHLCLCIWSVCADCSAFTGETADGARSQGIGRVFEGQPRISQPPHGRARMSV